MTDSYLWKQEPVLSGSPTDVLRHDLTIDGEYVCESAVLKLENEKFLFIRFVSEFKNDPSIGFTDVEEFDTLEEAVTLYNVAIGNQ